MLPRLLAINMFLLAVIFCPGKVSCAENPKPTEQEVKAAYIYNFAKFVEWPQGRFPDGSSNIHFCVLGDDQLRHHLVTIEGKNAGNKMISFKGNASIENLQGCEILFIGSSEEDRLDQILRAVKGSIVMSIGDTEGYAGKGVMINFYMENNKIRFEINPKAAKRSGIRISSNLLKIARIVGEQ